MGKGSCTQNIKETIIQQKWNTKNRENQIQELLNHLYKERSITGCQSTQTNKKKPLYLRGKKGLFYASLLNVSQHGAEMGAQAASLLIKKLESTQDQDDAFQTIIIETGLVERNSTKH